MTLIEQVGQKMAAGFMGYTLPDDFIALVKKHKVANVVLFTRNIRDDAQLTRLCADIQALVRAETGHDAFITIDQEGGGVSRLGSEAMNIPGAMALGATHNPAFATTAGNLVGLELAQRGVNFNLAPVMDVNSNPLNPVIGARSFGDDPKAVGEFGKAYIKGIMPTGTLCCAKHFPGHGDTAVDSHLGLPTVDKTREELDACEFVPFRAVIDGGIPAVMSSHILFPALDDSGYPATMSRKIMHDLLREEMGFDGLILSDCMMMQAISDHYGTVKGCVEATRAGCDIILVCHSPELTGQCCDAIVAAAEAGDLDAAEIAESARRIIDAKAKCLVRRDLRKPGTPEDYAALDEIRAHTVTFVGGPTDTLPALGDDPVFVGCNPFRTSMAADEDKTGVNFARDLAAQLGGRGIVTDVAPDDVQIAQTAISAAGHSCIVVATFNGHIRTQQMALVRALRATGVPVVQVALRNPYDLIGMTDTVWGLAAYQYDPEAVAAVAQVLRSGKALQRVPPVKL